MPPSPKWHAGCQVGGVGKCGALGANFRLELVTVGTLLVPVDVLHGTRLVLSKSSQAPSTGSLKRLAPGDRPCQEWAIGDRSQWAATVNHVRAFPRLFAGRHNWHTMTVLAT